MARYITVHGRWRPGGTLDLKNRQNRQNMVENWVGKENLNDLSKGLDSARYLARRFRGVAGGSARKLPRPALLVVHQGENTLSIVDPSTRKVMGRVPTADHGHSVAVSGDGKMAFVVNFSEGGRPGNSISVVDLAARKEVRRIDLGPLTYPHGMSVAGGKVYFTAQGSKAIGRYDPATNKVDLTLGTGQNGTHNLVVSKDLNQIFTANVGSGSMTAFERVTGKPVSNAAGEWNITVIPVGPAPQAIDMSPDGTEVWTGHGGDGSVSIIDVATKKVKQTVKLPYQGYNHLQFTPDGRRVLVSHLRAGELVVLDAAARKEIKRIKVGSSVTKFLIQPDGSRVYASVNADNNIAVVDLKTLELTGRISSARIPTAWHGSGRNDRKVERTRSRPRSDCRSESRRKVRIGGQIDFLVATGIEERCLEQPLDERVAPQQAEDGRDRTNGDREGTRDRTVGAKSCERPAEQA